MKLMSKKWKFEHNPEGYFELMKSNAMLTILEVYGINVLNQLPLSPTKTYEMSIVTGQTRSNVTVRATSYMAKKDNLKNNTLLKALGSVKDD